MPPLKSILVMADRSAEAQVALQKAFVIARHFDAKIDLLACDADQPWTARLAGQADEAARAASARGLDSRRFLEALRSTISADDLQIRVVGDCDGPLHEDLPRKVRADGHNLVVKRVARRDGRRRPALTPGDWQVIRACPVPLMLTRGRPWRPLPRIVASLPRDGATGDMVGVARYLAEGCHGALEIVEDAQHSGAPRRLAWGETLLEPMPGPSEIDVVVLRACGARPGEDLEAAALTERIFETHDCDVLLMPRPTLADAGDARG